MMDGWSTSGKGAGVEVELLVESPVGRVGWYDR
jgi:hypothetical protein